MGDLNVPRAEAETLKAIDAEVLRKLVDKCIVQVGASAVRSLQLDSCGPYVASRLRAFERALVAHQKAKSAKKRSTTEYDLRSAGSDLTHSVQQMKYRVAKEEEERQFFYVDDNVMPPSKFSEKLTVRVSYQWRVSASDPWSYGSIIFSHTDQPRAQYLPPAPARKPTAAQKEQTRQDHLYGQWDHLRGLSLQSVRDYFRRGGSGAAIPPTFQAKTDSHSHGLNNFSADFSERG